MNKNLQILAEILGTYFMIFAGCGAVVVNQSTGGAVTFPGICAVWGLVVTVLVYSVSHISGAHFNPAVTVAFATCGRFRWKQVTKHFLGSENDIPTNDNFFPAFCSTNGVISGTVDCPTKQIFVSMVR
jgi:glycerol uptake facilitator-like aquaporin